MSHQPNIFAPEGWNALSVSATIWCAAAPTVPRRMARPSAGRVMPARKWEPS